ncbi:hypothetical protein FSP39_008401 [Pinctada imbricata]|uniref:Uncharacterized protein n=1 Tax=Pinctada imbricata TaxID=66713 RepID=A0AA88YK65_PINIB|nr:hypothetical protein FSP39_008401 [Pinctada imbricata]
MDVGNAESKMETGCIATGIENFDFLECEIDDILLAQVCAEMENEFAVDEGFQDLTLSQTLEQYGHFDVALPLDPTEGENTREAMSDDDLCDTKRFGVAVSDQDLRTLIESKENANPKSKRKEEISNKTPLQHQQKNTRCKNTKDEYSTRRKRDTRHVNIKHKRLHINRRDQWATGADFGRPCVTQVANGVVILDCVRTTLSLLQLPRGLEERTIVV